CAPRSDSRIERRAHLPAQLPGQRVSDPSPSSDLGLRAPQRLRAHRTPIHRVASPVLRYATASVRSGAAAARRARRQPKLPPRPNSRRPGEMGPSRRGRLEANAASIPELELAPAAAALNIIVALKAGPLASFLPCFGLTRQPEARQCHPGEAEAKFLEGTAT